jgi:hypothetical protein
MNRYLFYNFSEAPTIFDQRKFPSCGSGETLSKKLFIFTAEISFKIFFLQNKCILDTYFLTMNLRLLKADNKLRDLITIY